MTTATLMMSVEEFTAPLVHINRLKIATIHRVLSSV